MTWMHKLKLYWDQCGLQCQDDKDNSCKKEASVNFYSTIVFNKYLCECVLFLLLQQP